MGGARVGALLALTAVLAGACSDRQSESPTAPDISAKVVPEAAPAACSFNTVSSLTKTEFGASSRQASQASSMKTAGAGTATATSLGFQILKAIGNKYTGSQTTTNASALTVALLQCMNIGGATVPAATVFDAALGAHGAYGVISGGDTGPVTSHDDAWLLEPPAPATTTWGTILPTGVNTILVYGLPVSIPNFSNDDGLSNIFDWNTLAKVTFTGNGVVVGNCTVGEQYLQHNPAGPTGEVLGFVTPSCNIPTPLSERAPATWGERLIRLLGPSPAFAALGATTGSAGQKRTLSPFQVIGPDSVELKDTLFSWKKSGNTVGISLDNVQVPMYQIKTQGGTRWLQDGVLIWIEAFSNNGVNVDMCNNWAYTNADGIAQFPKAYFNKAGGYTIVAKTTGTSSNGDIPAVPAGRSLLSVLVNVKNGSFKSCMTYHQGDNPAGFPADTNGFRSVN